MATHRSEYAANAELEHFRDAKAWQQPAPKRTTTATRKGTSGLAFVLSTCLVAFPLAVSAVGVYASVISSHF